jgi:hypothetical protein
MRSFLLPFLLAILLVAPRLRAEETPKAFAKWEKEIAALEAQDRYCLQGLYLNHFSSCLLLCAVEGLHQQQQPTCSFQRTL